MRGIRYTAEFKAEAIKQITERGHGGGSRDTLLTYRN